MPRSANFRAAYYSALGGVRKRHEARAALDAALGPDRIGTERHRGLHRLRYGSRWGGCCPRPQWGLHCTAWRDSELHGTARHGTATAQHGPALHGTALHCGRWLHGTADVGRVTAIVGRSAEAVPSELRLPVWCVVLGVYPERRELWSFMNDQIRERWTDLEEAERILGSGASPIPGVLGGVIEFAYQSLGETHVPLRPVVVDILVQMFPGPEHTAFVYAIYREHVRRMMRIDPGRVVTRTRSIIGKRDPDLDRHLAALYHRTRMLPACTG